MDIVVIDNGSTMPFIINYTKEEAEKLHQVWSGGKDRYIVDPLGYDQCLVVMYDELSSLKKKRFDVKEIHINQDDYERGFWKYLCKSNFLPRSRYIKNGQPFLPSEEGKGDDWKSINDILPENDKSVNKREIDENDIATEFVLIIRNDGHTGIDCRRKRTKNGDWSWFQYTSDNIVAWMKIPDCPFIKPNGDEFEMNR